MRKQLIFAYFFTFLLLIFTSSLQTVEARNRCSVLETIPDHMQAGSFFSGYTRLNKFYQAVGDGAYVQTSGSTRPGISVAQNANDSTLVDIRILATTITSTVYVNCDDDIGPTQPGSPGGIATYSQQRVETGIFFGNLRFPGDINRALYGGEVLTVRRDPQCRGHLDCDPQIADIWTSRVSSGATFFVRWMELAYTNRDTGETVIVQPEGSATWPITVGYHQPPGGQEPPVTPEKPTKADSKKGAGKNPPSKSGGKKQSPEKEGKSDPVDLFSGAYYVSNVDLSVPGIIPVEVSRYYSSAFSDEDGVFGKGSSLLPYTANVTVKKESNGTVTTAAGTELKFSIGDHTTVIFKDEQGNLQFTAAGQTGFAGNMITVQKDGVGLMTGAILNKPNGDKFLFDANGDLIKIQDRNNNAMEIVRDSDHKIMRVQDPSTSKGIDFTYDANSHITQATGLNGQIITYAYDDQGRLTGVTDPLSQTATFTYDSNGQVTVATDARGTQVVQNTYNSDGRVTHQVLGDSSTVDIEYPADGVRKVTDGNGHIMEHRFESHGMFTGYKTPLNQEYTVSYSPTLFDNSGGARTITNIDPQGRTVITELNNLNQPVKITDATGRVTEFSYEPNFHLLKTIKDPLGRITQFNYDAAGNVVTAIDPDGNQNTFTYNTQGQVLTATDALNQKAQYQYNPNHDLTQVMDPLGNKAQFIYDNLSRLTKVTDAKGNSTQYTYDILNRVTDIKDALNHVTHFTYDENGNVISVTDPKGQTTTASYDAMNRLASTTNSKNETSTITYDSGGNVESSTDAKGQTTTYTYNALDQVSKKEYADGTADEYTYDGVNRLTMIQRGNQSWNFAYDILDRLITENTPQGSLNYTYDMVSRLTGFSSPNTNYQPVQYAYDNLDRLTSVTQNGKTYGYAYDTVGRRTGLNRPNGVTTSYEYDAGSRLTSLTHNKGTQVLEKHDYTYDANGNIVKYVRGKGTSQPVVIKPCGKHGKGQIRKIVGYITDKAEELERNYTYDALNRLTAVNGLGMVPSASDFKNSGNKLAAALLIEQAKKIQNPNSRNQLLKNAEKLGAVLPESANWTFDENGNILTKTVHETDGDKLTSYAYDEADRMVEMVRQNDNDHPNRWCRRHPKFKHGPRFRHSCRLPQNTTETIDFTYDANGNLTADETGRTFTWNVQDQLTQLQDGTVTSQFSYDPLGRRVSFSKGSKTKSYFYQGLSLLSDGSSKFLDGVGLDEHLQVNGSNQSSSYLTDHLDSTSQLLNSTNGQSQGRYDYKSYGKLEGDVSNSSLTNTHTYTGREDDGNGLMYYRARFYDPDLEMFISQDPLGDAQRYVGGNPISFMDPLGLEADAIFISPIKDPRLYNNAKNITNTPDYQIVIHSDGKQVYIPRKTPQVVNGQNTYYQPISIEDFYKRYLQDNKNIKSSTPIVLIACHAGEGGMDSIAQHLAKLSGRTVYAPEGYGTIPSNGDYYSNNTPRFLHKYGIDIGPLHGPFTRFEP